MIHPPNHVHHKIVAKTAIFDHVIGGAYKGVMLRGGPVPSSSVFLIPWRVPATSKSCHIQGRVVVIQGGDENGDISDV